MDKYQKALLSIKKALLEGTLCFGKKRKVANRFAYWVHLEDIQIANALLIPKKLWVELGLKNSSTTSLAHLIVTQCNSDINETIEYIDAIIKRKISVNDSLHDELSQLQIISTLLRDIHALTQQAVTRRGRHYEKESLRTISTPVGPNIPGLVMSGFCCVCHRTTSLEEHYYCIKHDNSTGKERDVKKARRMIKDAFNNLGLDESHLMKGKVEKSNDKSREDFRRKSRRLLGWAKHRQEHVDYKYNLDKIFDEYLVFDERWPSDSISMIRKVATLSNDTNHTQKHFNLFIMIDRNKLISQLKREIFDLNEDIELDAQLAKKMFLRMSQFSLIKLAASKKNVIRLLN